MLSPVDHIIAAFFDEEGPWGVLQSSFELDQVLDRGRRIEDAAEVEG